MMEDVRWKMDDGRGMMEEVVIIKIAGSKFV
jgi:hypothetical protein